MRPTIERTGLGIWSNSRAVEFPFGRCRDQTVGNADVNPAILPVSAVLEANQHIAVAGVIADACDEAALSMVLAFERSEIYHAAAFHGHRFGNGRTPEMEQYCDASHHGSESACHVSLRISANISLPRLGHKEK